jgi:hypothetical protein
MVRERSAAPSAVLDSAARNGSTPTSHARDVGTCSSTGGAQSQIAKYRARDLPARVTAIEQWSTNGHRQRFKIVDSDNIGCAPPYRSTSRNEATVLLRRTRNATPTVSDTSYRQQPCRALAPSVLHDRCTGHGQCRRANTRCAQSSMRVEHDPARTKLPRYWPAARSHLPSRDSSGT